MDKYGKDQLKRYFNLAISVVIYALLGQLVLTIGGC